MASEQTGSGGDRPVILLVEDEALTIMDLGDVLEEGGYDTVQCASAERALSILQARPDICGLVTDVQLSGKTDGFDLASSVAEARPRLPILIVSGRAAPGSGPHARACRLHRPALHGRRYPGSASAPDALLSASGRPSSQRHRSAPQGLGRPATGDERCRFRIIRRPPAHSAGAPVGETPKRDRRDVDSARPGAVARRSCGRRASGASDGRWFRPHGCIAPAPATAWPSSACSPGRSRSCRRWRRPAR